MTWPGCPKSQLVTYHKRGRRLASSNAPSAGAYWRMGEHAGGKSQLHGKARLAIEPECRGRGPSQLTRWKWKLKVRRASRPTIRFTCPRFTGVVAGRPVQLGTLASLVPFSRLGSWGVAAKEGVEYLSSGTLSRKKPSAASPPCSSPKKTKKGLAAATSWPPRSASSSFILSLQDGRRFILVAYAPYRALPIRPYLSVPSLLLLSYEARVEHIRTRLNLTRRRPRPTGDNEEDRE